MSTIAPFSTWPIQTETLRPLYAALAEGRVPHAVLLAGSSEDTAELAAFITRLLLCTAPGAPCGRCWACLQGDRHPDAIRAVPDEHGVVKTAAIEQVQQRLSRTSHTGGRLVYTIPGVDLLNAVAANRLLKTLEEPNPSVVALLTATQPQNVLPTILSRCFIYSVQPRGTHAVWDDLLPEIPAKEETLSAEESFAAASKAVVQWAQTLLQGREGPVLLADSLLEAAAEMGVDVFLRLLAMYLRDVAHVQAGDREHVAVSDWQADLTRHARTVPMDRLYRAIPIVLEARVRLRSHVAPALNLERMCIRLREVLHGV